MKKIGIFYHPSFSRKSYMTIGNRLRDFPEALEELLQKPNVRLYESPRVSEELILKVHAPEMVPQVARDSFCSTAYESAGGVVAAMEALAKGEIDRAFCFIGAGGHHSGYQQFWGACCFNDVVLALTRVREVSSMRRLAVVDTDAHHGDGTRQLIADDPEFLHLCFCSDNYCSADGTKMDVDVYNLAYTENPDSQYVDLVRRNLPLIPPFKPDLLLWYYGFDTHRDDYGSLGLSLEPFFQICDLMIDSAEEMQVPLQVVLGGGSLSYLATRTIPEIIKRLAER
ncbi:MAG: histone deacetylase [Syntrophales bacterium]|nr:histone deacetylase [Syntrophales bacterium]MDD5640644.1 histone deacetylase [Syntrophales bacterium]